MRTRIGTRLILGAGLVTAAVIGLMTVSIVRTHTAQLVSERTRSADQLSETIKSSTHFDMLENRRDNLHRQIRAIGELQSEGIRKVRLFNKEGQIMFSSAKAEIGTTLDIRGEACYACHAEGRPLEKLGIQDRARIFPAGDGTRVLGIINPIPNEASCTTASCHAHAPSKRILGVLDVNVSMAEADAEIARSRGLMMALAVLAILASSLILWWLNRQLVLKPVTALLEGTRRVADGDLTTTIPVTAHDELGDLATAFNQMTHRLADTQLQLTQADKLASVGRLAAGIAHEINNPLTGVLSYASLLKKRFESDAAAAEDLEVIIRETLRCRGIIRELLDFARPAPPSREAREAVLNLALRLDFTDEAKSLKRVEVAHPRARILAVDDEPVVLDSFRRILVLEGYNVDTVETGPEALGLVQRNDYDFVFTDLKMPDMSGVEVVKAVKHLRPDVDVVVITGYGTIETAVETLQFGASEYVQKPFTADELAEFARKLLLKREARMEGQRQPTVRIISPAMAEAIPANEFCVPGGSFSGTRPHLGAH